MIKINRYTFEIIVIARENIYLRSYISFTATRDIVCCIIIFNSF